MRPEYITDIQQTEMCKQGRRDFARMTVEKGKALLIQQEVASTPMSDKSMGLDRMRENATVTSTPHEPTRLAKSLPSGFNSLLDKDDASSEATAVPLKGMQLQKTSAQQTHSSENSHRLERIRPFEKDRPGKTSSPSETNRPSEKSRPFKTSFPFDTYRPFERSLPSEKARPAKGGKKKNVRKNGEGAEPTLETPSWELSSPSNMVLCTPSPSEVIRGATTRSLPSGSKQHGMSPGNAAKTAATIPHPHTPGAQSDSDPSTEEDFKAYLHSMREKWSSAKESGRIQRAVTAAASPLANKGQPKAAGPTQRTAAENNASTTSPTAKKTQPKASSGRKDVYDFPETSSSDGANALGDDRARLAGGSKTDSATKVMKGAAGVPEEINQEDISTASAADSEPEQHLPKRSSLKQSSNPMSRSGRPGKDDNDFVIATPRRNRSAAPRGSAEVGSGNDVTRSPGKRSRVASSATPESPKKPRVASNLTTRSISPLGPFQTPSSAPKGPKRAGEVSDIGTFTVSRFEPPQRRSPTVVDIQKKARADSGLTTRPASPPDRTESRDNGCVPERQPMHYENDEYENVLFPERSSEEDPERFEVPQSLRAKDGRSEVADSQSEGDRPSP